MKIIAIIPARMAATRFPGKPLADLLGLPMIEHIRRRVALSELVAETVVATCDREIYDVVSKAGGKAAMTSDSHVRCTDRIAEAARVLSADIVINIQGDEPLIHPDMLAALVEPLLREPDLQCTNLLTHITSEEEFNSPNEVKTVIDLKSNVLYFSREPIPSVKKAGGRVGMRLKQNGMIAFRKDFLATFSNLSPTPLEELESVDMMRAIEHGYKIRAVLSSTPTVSVDVPEELEIARGMLEKDALRSRYM